MNKAEAFASYEILSILLFLSLFVSGCAIFLSNQNLFILKQVDKTSNKQKISKVEKTVLNTLKESSSRNENSFFDDIWRINNTSIDGIDIYIEEISSKININSIPTDYLYFLLADEDVNINKLCERINELRILNEQIFSIEQIRDSITDETFTKYFTFYNWININTIENAAFSSVLNNLNIPGTFYEEKRKSLLSNNQFITNNIDLSFFFGVDFTKTSHYITLLSEMNINMISEELLYKLLSIPKFNIAFSNEKAEEIISYRKNNVITDEQLLNYLGISKNNEIYYYLGCKSYFWKIILSYKNLNCELVICRHPSDMKNGSDTDEYYLIEKKWL